MALRPVNAGPQAQAIHDGLLTELDDMATVRCDICDGFGHNHTGIRGNAKSTKKCPVRKIMLRRLGKNKRNRAAINAMVSEVR